MALRSPRVWLGLALALAIAWAGWRAWKKKHDPELLFRSLPADNSGLAYLNVERLRASPALAPLLRQRVDPDPDYAAFVRQTGFDYARDLDAAAVCYLPDRVYVVAQGRFDQQRLRQYALSQSGSCQGETLDRPCRMPASSPQRRISFLMPSAQLLALATAADPDAVLGLQSRTGPGAESLAREAKQQAPASILWVTATPDSILQTLGPGGASSPQREMIAKVLAPARRLYFFVADRPPNLELSLLADCAGAEQAKQMQSLLRGLHDLAGVLLWGARGEASTGDWQKVLASVVMRQEQNKVRAAWTLEPAVLERIGR